VIEKKTCIYHIIHASRQLPNIAERVKDRNVVSAIQAKCDQ